MGMSEGHQMGPEQKCQYLGDCWTDFFETWHEYSGGSVHHVMCIVHRARHIA